MTRDGGGSRQGRGWGAAGELLAGCRGAWLHALSRLHARQVCNAMYNVNPVLLANIEASDYYKSLYELSSSFEAVVDEIFEKCSYSTPFMPQVVLHPLSPLCASETLRGCV